MNNVSHQGKSQSISTVDHLSSKSKFFGSKISKSLPTYAFSNESNKSFLLPSNKNKHTGAAKTVSFIEHNEFSLNNLFVEKDIVEKYLESIVLQNNKLILVRDKKILLNRDHELLTDQVKILTGGATAFDPLYSGFVGPGMVTAAVFGALQSSPPYMRILAALRMLAHNHNKGILIILMNNLADRLNFGLACQQAAQEGIKTMILTVGEDCSGISVSKPIGRKGSSGIIFLYKIAGAMAEQNVTLYEMHCLLSALKGKALGSINASFRENTLTISSGLKGEPGNDHREIDSCSLIVKHALAYIFHPSSYFSLDTVKGDEIALIVNNSSGFTDFHFSLVVGEVIDQIIERGLNILRVYSGRFLTSTKGGVIFSISVLKTNANMLKWLDHPVNVMSWPNREFTLSGNIPVTIEKCYLCTHKVSAHVVDSVLAITDAKNLGVRFTQEQATLAVKALQSITETIMEMEEYLNEIDFDHDYGTTLKTYMQAIQSEMDQRNLYIVTPYGMLNHLANLAASSMGGMSGAVFSVLCSSAAQAFLEASQYTPLSWKMWINAARMCRDAICSYTRVKPGDKTILDALHPFVETFTTPSLKCLSDSVEAAMRGAERTAAILQKGVTSKHVDPGALCLAEILRVTFTVLQVEEIVGMEVAHKQNDNEVGQNTSEEFTQEQVYEEALEV